MIYSKHHKILNSLKFSILWRRKTKILFPSMIRWAKTFKEIDISFHIVEIKRRKCMLHPNPRPTSKKSLSRTIGSSSNQSRRIISIKLKWLTILKCKLWKLLEIWMRSILSSIVFHGKKFDSNRTLYMRLTQSKLLMTNI